MSTSQGKSGKHTLALIIAPTQELSGFVRSAFGFLAYTAFNLRRPER